jgi:hypothetical protein
VTVTRDGQIKSTSTLTRNQWHGSSSVDYKDGVLMFADYASNAPMGKGEQARYSSGVFRSVDAGATWAKVHECSGNEIRHFHTVRADPFKPRTWYLTSGDLAQEVKVWISSDDGLTWQELALSGKRQRFRMTDMAFAEDGIFWGSDDTLGAASGMDPNLPRQERSGARVFFARRGSFGEPVELGYTGQPVRSIVDVGPAWFVITQGSIYPWLTRPGVFLLSKEEPRRFVHLFDVDNYSDVTTGFTFSCASRKAKDGIFFTVRRKDDVFKDHPSNLLKWSVRFD